MASGWSMLCLFCGSSDTVACASSANSTPLFINSVTWPDDFTSLGVGFLISLGGLIIASLSWVRRECAHRSCYTAPTEGCSLCSSSVFLFGYFSFESVSMGSRETTFLASLPQSGEQSWPFAKPSLPPVQCGSCCAFLQGISWPGVY